MATTANGFLFTVASLIERKVALKLDIHYVYLLVSGTFLEKEQKKNKKKAAWCNFPDWLIVDAYNII